MHRLTGYLSSRACASHGGVDCAFHCPHGACAGPTQLAPVRHGRGTMPNPQCAPTIRALVATSGRSNQTTMVEPAAVATFKCSNMDWTKPSASWSCGLAATADPAPYVGAFLIGRGPSAAFQVAVQPLFMLDYAATFPSLRLEPGLTTDPATEASLGLPDDNYVLVLDDLLLDSTGASCVGPAQAPCGQWKAQSTPPCEAQARELR